MYQKAPSIGPFGNEATDWGDRKNWGGAASQTGVIGGGAAMGACSRQSAKGVLYDRISRLRREADQLEALAGALPEKLPLEADSALWDLLIKR